MELGAYSVPGSRPELVGAGTWPPADTMVSGRWGGSLGSLSGEK